MGKTTFTVINNNFFLKTVSMKVWQIRIFFVNFQSFLLKCLLDWWKSEIIQVRIFTKPFKGWINISILRPSRKIHPGVCYSIYFTQVYHNIFQSIWLTWMITWHPVRMATEDNHPGGIPSYLDSPTFHYKKHFRSKCSYKQRKMTE